MSAAFSDALAGLRERRSCHDPGHPLRQTHRAGARITRGQRRVFVRIAEHWPWRHELAAAFARLAALTQPLRI